MKASQIYISGPCAPHPEAIHTHKYLPISI